MKPKKPDRFEREVNKLPHLFDTDDLEALTPMILRDDVVMLLRQQHRAVVRMVLREFKVWATTSPDGYASAPASRHERAKQCRDILDKLRKRSE